jgi:AraC-like DNA-binding protein
MSSYDFKDIKPHFIGEEQCLPGNISKVARPEYYPIIHYVRSGKGILYKNNLSIPVKEGEVFIIRPGEIATYVADMDDPWCYQWLGFYGTLALKMCELDDVFPFPEEFMNEMFEYIDTPMCEFHITAVLLNLYAKLMGNNKFTYDYVKKTKNYIKTFYTSQIKIEDIAKRLHLSPQYLSRYFKANTGISIQQYIINTRIKNAKYFLSQGYTVDDTALAVGFNDTSNFSKIFKREVGKSPIEYKKANFKIHTTD